jgi:hypothetical protein
MNTYKILGFTESVNECGCCGKTELKGTYAVEINDTILHYGSTCVKRNLGLKKDSEVKSEVKKQYAINLAKANEYFVEMGGLELNEKINKVHFTNPEWDILFKKINDLKQESAKKFNVKSLTR